MPKHRNSIVFSMLFCGAIAVGVVADLRASYVLEEKYVADHVANSAFLISEWIKGAFVTSDYVLRDIVSEVPIGELREPDPSASAYQRRMRYLEQKRLTLPHVFTVALYDEHCIATHTNTIFRFDANDRPYCKALRDNPDRQSVVTDAFFSSLGRLNVVQARRFDSGSQGFHGFALFGVDLEFFSKWLESVPIGQHGVIAIFDSHQILLARRPAEPGSVGKVLANETLKQFVQSGDAAGTIPILTSPDGEDRLYAARRVDGLPFIVAVGEATEDWQSRWRSRVAVELTALCLLIGMAVVILRNYRALAIRTGQLESANRKLAELSATDGLTELANRRHFDVILEREFARSKRTAQPLALAILDVDYFKKFNDHYGHQAGDDCLKAVARTLRAGIHRATDLAARYGGEEFVLVLPVTSSAAARNLAEKIRQAVEALDIPHQTTQTGRDCVTISIGVATSDATTGHDAKELIEAADRALYRAKGLGRNRVCIAPNLRQSIRSDLTDREGLLKLAWHPSFESGHPVIDEQHRALFESTSALLRAILGGQSMDEVSALLDALTVAFVQHFHDEEAIFLDAGFPDAADHLAAHRALLDRAGVLIDGFHSGQVGVAALFQFLADDLIRDHILDADRHFFPYLVLDVQMPPKMTA
jgi:diguanylate cyclase (GGDEF)-like protein/hemerythrin-like metal-binding protein